MTQIEILEEIKKLSTAERLTFIEAAIHLIREDLQLRHRLEPRSRPPAERRRELEAAAKALLPDYGAGGELTNLTDLDGKLCTTSGKLSNPAMKELRKTLD